jgi:hypothetical protein
MNPPLPFERSLFNMQRKSNTVGRIIIIILMHVLYCMHVVTQLFNSRGVKEKICF